jgi:threonine dehydratase
LSEFVKVHAAQVAQAAERIRSVVRRTPTLTTDLDPGLRLKPESFQLTGSFKPRGAFNAVLSMLERGNRPAGTLPLAAYLSGKLPKGRTGLVLSGGNADLSTVATLLSTAP